MDLILNFLFEYKILICLFSLLVFFYFSFPFICFSLLGFLSIYLFELSNPFYVFWFVISLVFSIPLIRSYVVSFWILKIVKKILPPISDTEKVALEAGKTWIETEFFSSKPSFKNLLKENYPQFSEEEKQFMKGPLKELCEMMDSWEIHKTRKIPDSVMDFIKENKFFGMIIPKEYGGLGFSAYAHSHVISVISSKSLAAGVSVMVPNSLGPAELLLHYGTDEQKNKYLKDLATGKQIPCFALTEPEAGSDARGIKSSGTIFKKDGKLFIRLNWEKRWITLSSISTVLGIAFQLKDPDGLLGDKKDLGITCALVDSSLSGIEKDKRHDPLGVPFYNCPTKGVNVEISVDDIIGGISQAGNGWKMLMECLTQGRGISLPAQAFGGIQLSCRFVTAHCQFRKQFGLSLRKFEGVEEVLAGIISANYYIQGMKDLSLSGIDAKKASSVVTAISKYISTETCRKVINDSMDLLGGTGISMGPKNPIAPIYIGIPIGITVEGANILTRTLMIFGQGVLRSFPYAYDQMKYALSNDLRKFDVSFFSYLSCLIQNKIRFHFLFLTRGFFVITPGGALKRFYQKLYWSSAALSYLSGISMVFFGGDLKRKEKMTGRFADVMTYLYIATGVIFRYEKQNKKKEDLYLASYSLKLCFSKIQKSFEEILRNYEVPVIGFLFRKVLYFIFKFNPIELGPSDKDSASLCLKFVENLEERDRLSLTHIYWPKDPQHSLSIKEEAFRISLKSDQIIKRLKKTGLFDKKLVRQTEKLALEAFKKGLIDESEKKMLLEAKKVILQAIQVDDFSENEYLNT